MSELESLIAALDQGHAFGKTMADLPAKLYRRVERELGGIGHTSPPPSAVAFAIVGNSAAAANGSWQYSIDQGNTWIEIPMSGLSDSSAIVLPLPAKLRFNRVPNWFGTPGGLSVRVLDGPTEVPSPGVADISEGTWGAGKWLRGVISIAAQPDGTPSVAESTLTAGNLWDRLTIEQRRIWAEQRDKENDPALEQERQRVWEAEVRRGDQEREVANLIRQIAHAKEMPASSPRDELDKIALLDLLQQKLTRAELDLEGLTPNRGSSTGNHDEIYVALVKEVARRKGSGESHTREPMVIWLGTVFPDLGERGARKLYQTVPIELRGSRRGRRPGGKSGHK